MQCPNCQFELKNPGPNCPFCQYSLELPKVEKKSAHPPVPGQPEPKPQPKKEEPESFDIPDPMDVSFAGGNKTPVPEIPAAPATVAPPSAGNSPVKLLLIIGGAFLAYKVGMFDNILMLFGMGAAPAPMPIEETVAAQPDPAIPTIESVPAPAPAPRVQAAPAEQTFDPSEDPRMRAMNSEIDEQLAAADAARTAKKPGANTPAGASPTEEEEEAEEGPDWIFKGLVYDVISLNPVASANMMLMDKSQQHIYTTITDAKGAYVFEVPPVEGGYQLIIDHAYYLADYYEETSPPYKTKSMDQRRRLRAVRPKHKSWRGADKPLRRDIVLFPEIPDR